MMIDNTPRTILYVGGFEMPDKNAAAHRVVNNAKIFRKLGYRVVFVGISRTNSIVSKTVLGGFECWSVPYPTTTVEWIRYLSDFSRLRYIMKIVKPEGVIFYNYQAISFAKALHYCKKNNIWTISDVTEWYLADGGIVFRIIKQLDTSLRMRWLNTRTDAVIAISNYLRSYYLKKNRLVTLIPPLIDLEDEKWKLCNGRYDDGKIHLVYAGNTSGKKDDLLSIIQALKNYENIFAFHIIGIEESVLSEMVPEGSVSISKFIICHGKMHHEECIEILKKCDFQIFIRPENLVTKAGFPTKLGESFACGIPVLTNKSSNITDYLRDGVNGFLIRDTSSDAVEDVLKLVSGLEKVQLLKLKENCRTTTDFDFRNYRDVVQQMMTIICGEDKWTLK